MTEPSSTEPAPESPKPEAAPEPHFLDSLTDFQATHIRQLLAYCYVCGYNDCIRDSDSILRKIDASKLATILWNQVRTPPTVTEAQPSVKQEYNPANEYNPTPSHD